MRVGVVQRIASALGLSAPLASSLASPWADSSGLADVSLSSLFYLGDNVRQTRGNAMKLSVVSRGRDQIAGTVGRLPVRCVKDGQKQPTPAIILQPDPSRPRSQSFTWLTDQLIFYPCTWWRVTRRDAYGWPADSVQCDYLKAELNTDGLLVGYDRHKVGDDQPAGWQQRDFIRFDGPGEGLLSHADRALRRAYAIEMAAAKAEDNPVPSFELHDTGNETLTAEEIGQRVKTWVDNRRRYGVAWTSKNLETKTAGVQPEQLLIDGRKRVDAELARHMNMPAWLADIAVEGTALTYANLTDKGRDLVNSLYSLYMSAIADRLGMGDITPRGWEVEFDTDAITRPDMKARFDAYKVGKDGKFVTNEQIAAWEGWDTVPEEAAG